MKNRILILAVAVTLAAIGGIASAAVAAARFDGGEKQARRQAELDAGGYVLADHQGRVGLYEGGDLLLEADIPVSGLRQADRELIAGGIRAETYEDALKLLEDFGA